MTKSTIDYPYNMCAKVRLATLRVVQNLRRGDIMGRPVRETWSCTLSSVCAGAYSYWSWPQFIGTAMVFSMLKLYGFVRLKKHIDNIQKNV